MTAPISFRVRLEEVYQQKPHGPRRAQFVFDDWQVGDDLYSATLHLEVTRQFRGLEVGREYEVVLKPVED